MILKSLSVFFTRSNSSLDNNQNPSNPTDLAQQWLMARWARARKAAEVKPVETLPAVDRQRCPICLDFGDSQWVAWMDDIQYTGDGIRGVVFLTYCCFFHLYSTTVQESRGFFETFRNYRLGIIKSHQVTLSTHDYS